MILDYFISGFRTRFPERAILIRREDATAVISGGFREVGNIEIQDDRDELIVFVGNFTHGHFDCYDGSLTNDEQQQQIANDVLDFLADVFADKVEFFHGNHGGGGWRPVGTGPEKSFTWSGPVNRI